MAIKIVRRQLDEAIPIHDCPTLVPLRVEKICMKRGEVEQLGCDMGNILVVLPGQVASVFNATKGIVFPLTNLHHVLCSVARDIQAVQLTLDGH